jgi:hypothetical protein
MRAVPEPIVCPCNVRCHTKDRTPCCFTCVGHHAQFMKLAASPPLHPITLSYRFRCSGPHAEEDLSGQYVIECKMKLESRPPELLPPEDWIVARFQGLARIFGPRCFEAFLTWAGVERTRMLTDTAERS